MTPGIPIIVAAPSGAGKTSLVAALVKQLPQLMVSISHTTRAKREAEKEGVNYYFISETSFQEKIAAHDFLEYAKVFNHYYGTSKQWLESKLAEGIDVILEIDWQGAAQVRKYFPQSLSIFIFPPSLSVLEERLKKRGQDDVKTISFRMEQARNEMSHYHEFDYLVINEDFETAVLNLKAIVQASRLSQKRMADKIKWLYEE